MEKLFFLIISLSIFGCSSVYLERDPDIAFTTLFFGTVVQKSKTPLDVDEPALNRFANRFFAGEPIDTLGRGDEKNRFDEPSGYFYMIKISDGSINRILSSSAVDIGSCVEVISSDDTKIEILQVVPQEKCA